MTSLTICTVVYYQYYEDISFCLYLDLMRNHVFVSLFVFVFTHRVRLREVCNVQHHRLELHPVGHGGQDRTGIQAAVLAGELHLLPRVGFHHFETLIEVPEVAQCPVQHARRKLGARVQHCEIQHNFLLAETASQEESTIFRQFSR